MSQSIPGETVQDARIRELWTSFDADSKLNTDDALLALLSKGYAIDHVFSGCRKMICPGNREYLSLLGVSVRDGLHSHATFLLRNGASPNIRQPAGKYDQVSIMIGQNVF